MKTEEKKFCICCNEEVSFSKIMRDGNLESVCAYCGFVVEVRMPPDRTARDDSISGHGQSRSIPAESEDPLEMTVPAQKVKGKGAGTREKGAPEKGKRGPQAKEREEERKNQDRIEKELKERREQFEKEERQRRSALEKEEQERREQLEKEVRERRARLEREEKELRENLEKGAREEKERREQEERERIKADCVIIADGSPLVCEFLRGMLIKKGLSREVIASENGAEFMIAYSNRASEKKPVNLVILDLDMPVMDGLTTAHAMRSMERKYEVPKKIPILFFSAEKSDEALRSEMKVLRPALYLNKGDTEDPAVLIGRIDQLVARLLEKPIWTTT